MMKLMETALFKRVETDIAQYRIIRLIANKNIFVVVVDINLGFEDSFICPICLLFLLVFFWVSNCDFESKNEIIVFFAKIFLVFFMLYPRIHCLLVHK